MDIIDDQKRYQDLMNEEKRNALLQKKFFDIFLKTVQYSTVKCDYFGENEPIAFCIKVGLFKKIVKRIQFHHGPNWGYNRVTFEIPRKQLSVYKSLLESFEKIYRCGITAHVYGE